MTTIPLNQLVPAKTNVRKTGSKDGIEELAASIAAHGLLTSLTVRKSGRGKFAVIAGQRRYHALSMLVARDQIPADLPVLCRIVERDADATELGLAENVVRLAMHPADQFEAFRSLVDKGASAADIAARFGVPETTVAKRLKLGRVSPAILDAYRDARLSLEQVQAFSVSDDPEAQERVWAAFNGQRINPHAIRQALTEDEIPSDDRRVQFIGLDAYEAAGGPVRRDLFDEEGGGYLQDAGLLDQLVQQKLESVAGAVKAEGWSWTEVYPDFGYGMRGQFRRCHAEHSPLPEAEAAELEALQVEYDTLREAQYEAESEDDPAVTARMDAIEERVAALTDQPEIWTADQMATAGAVVRLSADGEAEVERGFIRAQDEPEDDTAATEAGAEAPSPAPSLPATLVADLTAQKTAAIRATLASQPDVALAAVTHALARSAFYDYGGETCLTITVKQRSLATSLAGRDDCNGLFAFDAERGKWADRLPGDAGDLWAWCIAQTQETLLDLLAVCVAHTVDAVHEKGARGSDPRLFHAEALARALHLDMREWFTPTAANYFGRVNRTFIMEALTEAGLPARARAWSKLKKTELAALAEREIRGAGWLPQPLRLITDRESHDTEQDDMPVAKAA